MEVDPDYGRFYNAIPAWATGHISYHDGLFLREAILREKPSIVLELGTASGFSAASLCHSLEVAARSAGGDPNYRVVSYDSENHFYADPSRAVGDAARAMLGPSLLAHVEFRHPRTARDAVDEFPPDSLSFVFIDADHSHPWPTLDLLALLDVIRPGGSVYLHDINLPLVAPEHRYWGPHHLFADLELEKEVSQDPTGIPNIGRLRMPDDKKSQRQRLVGMLDAHPWEGKVDRRHLARLGVCRYAGAWRDVPWLGRASRVWASRWL